MQLVRMKPFIGAAAALALCMSPTMAAAATSAPVQSINPLIAVSVFGTQASAQQVRANIATAAATAGVAVAAQGQDTPPAEPPPASVREPGPSGIGISPVILGLIGIAALAALIASSNNDSDSPASPD